MGWWCSPAVALIDSATTSHPPLPSPILTLSLNHDIEFKGCQIVSDMKLHTGGITTGNCFEFELRFSGTGLSVVEEPYRRPCFYTACHSSESRSGEQVGISPNNCPRKQPLGAFQRPYMAPLIPPLIVREKATLPWINITVVY